MRRRAWMAGCLPVLLSVVAGCSTPANPASENPPLVAGAGTRHTAAEEQSAGQPVEIVVVEKQVGSSAGGRYISKFQSLNASCLAGGSSNGSNSNSFTFTPNVTAGFESTAADEIRSTGFFARVRSEEHTSEL